MDWMSSKQRKAIARGFGVWKFKMKVPAWSGSGEHCLLFCRLLIVILAVFWQDREQGETAGSSVVPRRTLLPFMVSGPYSNLIASSRSHYHFMRGSSVSKYKLLKFTNIKPTTNTLSNNYYFDFWNIALN